MLDMRGQTMNTSKFVQNTGIATALGAILALIGVFSFIGDPALETSTTGFGLMTRILFAAGLALIIAGFFGLWRSGGLDQSSALAKVGLGMSVAGQGLIILNVFIRNNMLSIVSALILSIGMIIIGIAVLQANQWQSWRRFIPILYGLFPLSAIFLYPIAESITPNSPDHLLSIMTISIFLLFGIALWIEAAQLSPATE